MEIKCLEHRKVVVLFSADQTATEIEFNLEKHNIGEIWRRVTRTERTWKQSYSSMGGSTEGIWEDWPEEENRRGR